MEAKFEQLLKEYDDDEIGDLEDEFVEETGEERADASKYDDVIEDFLETGPFHVFKRPETFGENPQDQTGGRYVRVGKYAEGAPKESPYEILDKLRREAKNEKLGETHGGAIVEDDHVTNTKLDGMLKSPQRQEWDCETILTTYSNLENHPKVVAEPSRVKIAVNSKGMPFDVEDDARERLEKKLQREREAEEEAEAQALEEEEEEVVVVPNERARGETTEERKARKKAVKEARKQRRETKKSTKEAFKGEQRVQVERAISNQKNPVHINL